MCGDDAPPGGLITNLTVLVIHQLLTIQIKVWRLGICRVQLTSHKSDFISKNSIYKCDKPLDAFLHNIQFILKVLLAKLLFPAYFVIQLKRDLNLGSNHFDFASSKKSLQKIFLPKKNFVGIVKLQFLNSFPTLENSSGEKQSIFQSIFRRYHLKLLFINL